MLTAIANNIQAREDWQRLAERARAAGLDKQVDKLEPPVNAGWRTIDKRLAKLREAMEGGTR